MNYNYGSMRGTMNCGQCRKRMRAETRRKAVGMGWLVNNTVLCSALCTDNYKEEMEQIRREIGDSNHSEALQKGE